MYIAGVTEREFWNEAYLREPHTTMVPNHLLPHEVEALPVGTALDIGCGNGTNALGLAAIGWKVTGVDWAEEAVFLAERAAFQARVNARFEIADAATWSGGTPFDLVVCTFALPAGGAGASVIRNTRRLLAPGGTVLIAEWDRSMSQPWNFRPCELYDPATIVSMLPDMEVHTAEVRHIPEMFVAGDPRAAHGSWANVTVVKASRPA